MICNENKKTAAKVQLDDGTENHLRADLITDPTGKARI
jgi:hypothetical protein